MDYIVFYFMKRPNISSEKNMQPTMIATVKIEHITETVKAMMQEVTIVDYEKTA